jgi:hypothetical protein
VPFLTLDAVSPVARHLAGIRAGNIRMADATKVNSG